MQSKKNMLKAICFLQTPQVWTVSLKVERILDMDVAEERYLYGPPPTPQGYGCVLAQTPILKREW